MRDIDAILDELSRRGQLWQPRPGLTGLRGDLHALFRALEGRIIAAAWEETSNEWRVPPAIAFETLARADYFASMPQWLTAASHLSSEVGVLERVATSPEPGEAARRALAPAGAALSPALCYHVFESLAGQVLEGAQHVTTQGTCWRHEGQRLAPLERGWAFTMREVVCLGAADEVEAFRQRGVARVRALASSLGLKTEVVVASDPFFAPTSRGKALLQRVKALKHELVVPLRPGQSLAIASFNHHQDFFGEAFDIRLDDGTPATSGCVAFGLERWALAFVAAHGADPEGWPTTEPAEHPTLQVAFR